jgi:hypothetical protein
LETFAADNATSNRTCSFPQRILGHASLGHLIRRKNI